MNALRLTCRLVASLIGLIGVVYGLTNIPWRELTVASGRAQAYLWSNLVLATLFPILLCLAVTIGLLLIARIDERIERLETNR